MRGSAVNVTDAADARACRATLLRASRSTASTSGTVSSGTLLSSGPSKVSSGSKPSVDAASDTTRTASVRRPVSFSWDCSEKIVCRMARMVSSMSSMNVDNRFRGPSESMRALSA